MVTELKIRIKTPEGKGVDGTIIVVNNGMMATFNEKTLARRLYIQADQEGKKVEFYEEYNAYLEHYYGKSEEEIVKILRTEIIRFGGKVL